MCGAGRGGGAGGGGGIEREDLPSCILITPASFPPGLVESDHEMQCWRGEEKEALLGLRLC